jgi:hypothetical protein
MSDTHAKHVSLELLEELRKRAAQENLTVNDYLFDLVRRDLALPSRQQWVAQVQSREAVDVQVVDMVDAVRAGHEHEMSLTGS